VLSQMVKVGLKNGKGDGIVVELVKEFPIVVYILVKRYILPSIIDLVRN
jgi:hypothetical protein